MIDGRLPENPVGRQVADWLPVVAYAGLIFCISSLSEPSPVQLPELPLLDKLIHFLVYAIFGFLLFRALNKGRSSRRALILSFLAASIYGLTDELHQYFVPMREAELLDLLADSAGGLAGGYARFMINNGGSVG